MENEIIINVDSGETRVALLEQSVFSELHIERQRGKSVVGNVVKGRVSRVLPGMQAAFVDIGLEKAAFLYVGDYFDNVGGEQEPGPGRGGRKGRGGRRTPPPRIDTVLSEGQEIVVQIAKAPIGTKGARITSNISIPGRHLVLTPWSPRVGVSRRIDSDRERKRLREIIDRLRPKNLGFIIRTAGDGVREADLEADIRYLKTVWESIQLANAEKTTPSILHAEPDLPLRIIRDAASSETKRIVIDDPETHESVKKFLDEFVADPKPQIEKHDGLEPLFEKMGLEAQIHANLERKVWLKSGGSLIVDQCEALTAIDVNTGRFVGKRDLEETVYKTNLEAVKEVVNQLRFRNIGGLIIIDLIDMESADHREKTYRALREALRRDKARTNILKISELGLVEMTRKRTRENLVQTLCEPCVHCEGRGYLLSDETVTYNLLREIRNALPRFSGRRVAITVAPRVAEQLLGSEAKALSTLSDALGHEIEVRARPGIHQEQFEVEALDEGPPVTIPLRWLRDPAEIAAEEEARSSKSSGNGRSSRRRGRGRRRNGEASKEAGSTDEEGESTETDESPRPSEAELPDAEIQTPSSEAEATAGVETEAAAETASPEPLAEVESVEPHGEVQVTAPNGADNASGTPAAEEPTPASEAPGLLHAAEETTLEEAPAPEVTPETAEEAQPVDDEAESRILPRS